MAGAIASTAAAAESRNAKGLACSSSASGASREPAAPTVDVAGSSSSISSPTRSSPTRARPQWGTMRSAFAQMDDEAEAEEDGHDKERLAKLRAELAVHEIQEVRIAKRGGGTRKLTLREQLLLRSLMREPAERNDDDVQMIVRATADIKFFQRLTQSQHVELCREMGHIVVPGETTLFKQGDEGSTFYIVYRGCCKLYASDASLNWTRTCVGKMEDGSSFGELALLGNGKRSASAVTTSTSIVFTVEKISYERTLQKVHEQELDSVITFLRSIFLFQGWSDEELRRLASCTTRRRRAHPSHDRRARCLSSDLAAPCRPHTSGMSATLRSWCRARILTSYSLSCAAAAVSSNGCTCQTTSSSCSTQSRVPAMRRATADATTA